MEVVLIILVLALLIAIIIGMGKTFAKAGEPGWACIIPIYNVYVMCKMAGKSGWWVLLCIIPYVGIIFQIIVYNEIAKGFGRGAGTTVAMVFGIGWMILGFGDATWKNQVEMQNPDILHS